MACVCLIGKEDFNALSDFFCCNTHYTCTCILLDTSDSEKKRMSQWNAFLLLPPHKWREKREKKKDCLWMRRARKQGVV